MAKPSGSINKIRTTDNTDHDIIPDAVGNGSYKASCPSLTQDETLATESYVNQHGGGGTQIVTLYDKDITALNLGYGSGIPSSTEWTMDITGYKFIKIYYQMYFVAAYNTGGNCNILELGVNTNETWNIAHANPFYYDNGSIVPTQFALSYRFNTSTKKNTVYFWNGGSEATSVSAFHIFRIEGVK